MSVQVSYWTAHRNVVSERGKATDHRCITCNRKAKHWAYNHRCPDQMEWQGHPYCADPSYYMPMCCKCHYNYDANVRAARAIIESLPPAM